MTRPFASKARTLTFVALFVAIVTILAALPSSAQVQARTGGQASGDLSVAQQVHVSSSQGRAADSDNPFFLPPVDYNSGAWGAGSAMVADVNKDGKLDIVVVNAGGGINFDGTVGVLLGNGAGTFQPVVLYDSGGWEPAWLAVADVNGDGTSDLIVANRCDGVANCDVSGSVGILLGNGDGTFRSVVTYGSGGVAASGVAVADVNGDGKPDIVTTNCDSVGGSCLTNGAGIVGVLLGNGDGTFKAAVTYNLNRLFGSFGADGVAIADVNDDGIPDLVVGTGSGGDSPGAVVVLSGNGDGTFYPQDVFPVGTFSPASWPVVADVNGDGIPDLLAVSYYSDTVSVLLGQGHGLFRPALSYDLNREFILHPVSVAVADVNGDGQPDLVVGMDSCGSACVGFGAAVLFGNGDGTFQTAVIYGGGTYSAVVADLNHDGKLDIVGANSGPCCNDGAVAVLMNNRQGPPYTSTTTALASSANPAARKQSITYTSTVTSQTGGAVSGTVTFFQDGLAIATLSLIDNHASWNVTYKKVGGYRITAAYSGDAANSPSNSSLLVQYVGALPVGSRTTVSTSQSPSLYGHAVTFTARVTWLDGTAPDGESVTFSDGANPIGTGTTAAGVATLTIASLAAGTHVIGASYPGDAKLKPSHGQIAQGVAVPPVPTKTVVTTSGSPSLLGQPVTFTAVVTSQYGTIPDGELVTFYDGSAEIGTGTTASGVATFTTSSLTAKTHTIKATYAGDGTFKARSAKITQVVE